MSQQDDDDDRQTYWSAGGAASEKEFNEIYEISQISQALGLSRNQEKEIFLRAVIEINAQLSRFVYRGQLTNDEAAERSVAQANALIEALKKANSFRQGRFHER